VVITTGGKKIEIERSKDFLLEPGGAVNVSTRESIGIPRDHICRVGATWRFGDVGIVTSLGCQVDPGFRGRLRFSAKYWRRPIPHARWRVDCQQSKL